MVRYSILVDGRVQGVGFRYFTQIIASTLNLTGFCENLINGKVQIEVQGTDENVNLFVAKIKQGNTFCRVSNVELVSIPIIISEKKYSIKY
jgi:acylphosphatase